VSDSGNSRVQVFKSNGEVRRVFGSKGADVGQLHTPRGICCGGGSLFVVDTNNHRLQQVSIQRLLQQGDLLDSDSSSAAEASENGESPFSVSPVGVGGEGGERLARSLGRELEKNRVSRSRSRDGGRRKRTTQYTHS
jgi:hypothetical protein